MKFQPFAFLKTLCWRAYYQMFWGEYDLTNLKDYDRFIQMVLRTCPATAYKPPHISLSPSGAIWEICIKPETANSVSKSGLLPVVAIIDPNTKEILSFTVCDFTLKQGFGSE